jgi:cytochrome c oxidase subunit I+III
LIALCAGLAVDIIGQWDVGWRPWKDGHAAMLGMGFVLQGQLTAAIAVMTLFTIARRWAGYMHVRRRIVFDNVRILWLYTVAQSLVGLLLMHGFPWVST